MPSNFNQSSFDCLPEIVKTFPDTPLKILFFHPIGLSNSITDLLLLPRGNREDNLISFSFCKQCMEIEKELPQIKYLKWKFFYGDTLIAFKNFLAANNIETIVIPKSYRYESICKQSLNPMLFLEKCGLPIISISPRATSVMQEQVEPAFQ